jgi:hypothetical protein
MVDDPNRKSHRSFQCRDALWDALQGLASENGQTVDYLLNEAVRAYLQAQGRAVFGPRAAPTAPPVTAAPPRPGPPPMPPVSRPGAGGPPGIPRMPPVAGPGAGPKIPALPSSQMHGPGGPPAIPQPPPRMPPAGPGAIPTAPPTAAGPRVPPMAPRPAPAAAPREKQLVVSYEGEEFVVSKDEFFIGRGQKVCDLVVRDTNVSRQHAKVMRHNGAWWMLDNQSLNGVEFRGAKLQQKRIEDGDVFTVCGHPLQFSFR